MKILMLSSYLPFPLMSGGQNRLYNIIKELSQRHEITLICEKRAHQTKADIQEVEKICQKVITVERRKQWSLNNILNAGISGHSFLYTGHLHDEMRDAIQKQLAIEKFDIIHIETFYVFQNLPDTKIPTVLVEHNIEYSVYEKFKQKAPVYIRPLLTIDINKIKKEEEYFWKRATKVAAVSEDDRKVIEKAGIATAVVSNGVNPDQFTLKDFKKSIQEKEQRILFIGDFKWIQNQDAASWIIKEIWPIIKKKKREQNLKLWIVGRVIPDSIKSLTNDPDVLFDEKGSAAPTWEIFQKANIQLAPIRVGGGTSYKILEAMSCGTPNIITPLSAHALHAEDEKQALVGDSAEELAEKALKVLQEDKLYEKISHGGRKLIEDNYTWKAITKTLEQVYRSVQ
jgi:glycosyltransferase involved in cell wall biosynthesis